MKSNKKTVVHVHTSGLKPNAKSSVQLHLTTLTIPTQTDSVFTHQSNLRGNTGGLTTASYAAVNLRHRHTTTQFITLSYEPSC